MAFVSLTLGDDIRNRLGVILGHAVVSQRAQCQIVDLIKTEIDAVTHALFSVCSAAKRWRYSVVHLTRLCGQVLDVFP
ncbi:hypothetical protein D3C87_1350640 [compost metagenome]